MTDQFTQRMKRAAESLLDNESLTADLDDAAAQALINWGLACAELIVQRTSSLDDAATRQVIEPKLAAVRKLMRLVNRWVASFEAGKPVALLSEVIEQAAIIYPDYREPDPEQQQAFLREPLTEDPSQWIVKLRKLVAGAYESAGTRSPKSD